MIPPTTLTKLFYFTTINPREWCTVTTLLLSIKYFSFQKFKCFHKICMLHSNFTFSSLDLYVFIWYCTSVCNKKYHCILECLARCKVLIFVNIFEVQKSPSSGVPWKRCSENMQQIYRRTPCRSMIFEITLRHGFSHLKLLHIFRTTFLKNTSG